MGPGNPPTQVHREEKELNETSSAHLGDSQSFTAFSPQTAVIDIFFFPLFLKRCSIRQVETRYQPDTSTGRGRSLEAYSKLETCREQHFFFPAAREGCFFNQDLDFLSSHLCPQIPIPKAGRGKD